MQHLKFLVLVFEKRVTLAEAPCFHAALMYYLDGWFADLLCYPLVQLKLFPDNGLYQPMLLCLGPKIEKVAKLFSNSRPVRILIKNQAYPMDTVVRNIYNFLLQPCRRNHWQAYDLLNYQVLDDGNCQYFQQLPDEGKRLAFLKEQLETHLYAFACGIGWQLKAPIEITNLRILRKRDLPGNNGNFPCFDLNFRCNLVLPEYIGLGHEVAKGAGVLKLDTRGLN